MNPTPLISVVTPFYNTAPYLAECIERTLSQTYSNFELILVNNCSTDGSREIALQYAQHDARIRVVDNERFVGQVENYNNALLQISPDSAYCKIVQADDWMFSDCLSSMIEVAHRDSRIGIVGSYYLLGTQVKASGIPYGRWKLGGRELCRMQLPNGWFFMGSPTSLLFRSDIIRARMPFYAYGRYHEDTEAAYEILSEYDFGFCHQVLTFLRVEEGSIMGKRQSFNPNLLDLRLVIERFGPQYLTEQECRQRLRWVRRQHERFLGESLIRFKSKEFWRYHEGGLETIGQRLPWHRVAVHAVNALLDMILNPKNTLIRVARALARALIRRFPQLRKYRGDTTLTADH